MSKPHLRRVGGATWWLFPDQGARKPVMAGRSASRLVRVFYERRLPKEEYILRYAGVMAGQTGEAVHVVVSPGHYPRVSLEFEGGVPAFDPVDGEQAMQASGPDVNTALFRLRFALQHRWRNE